MKIKLFVMAILSAFSCVNVSAQKTATKVLVAYYSWGGNTRAMAQKIQILTGADLFEIVPTKPYPANYNVVLEQTKKEIKSGYKPEIKPVPQNLAQYDVVFVGTPNWWSTMAPPVKTFLSLCNLSGKKVIPFVTHGGGGVARCESDMKQMCNSSVFGSALAIYGDDVDSSEKEIEKWVKNYGLKK